MDDDDPCACLSMHALMMTAPHVCTSDPTWTIGLGVIQDLNRKSKREYGRLCILQCSWYPDLKEVSEDTESQPPTSAIDSKG